jgi:hypothetical protein
MCIDDPPRSGKIAQKAIGHFGDEMLKGYPLIAKIGGKAK